MSESASSATPCPDCGQKPWIVPCDCPPVHIVRFGASFESIRAVSPEQAAELWAAGYDEKVGGRKPYIVSTGPVRVSVTDQAGRETWWRVSGKRQTTYTALEDGK